MFIQKKSSKIVADTEVAPEADELLFEAEDVAQLAAEITGEDVTVTTDDESEAVVFTVGEDEFVVEPEGDEEILEAASVKATKGKKAIAASTNRSAKNSRTFSPSKK